MAEGPIVLGTVPRSGIFGIGQRKVVLTPSEWLLHKWVMGLSRVGKSKMLETMWQGYFENNVGCTIIDPHSASIEAILTQLVGEGYYDDDMGAYQKVLWLEFAEGDYYPPFDLTALPYTDIQIVKILLEGFKRLWPILQEAAMFDMVMKHGLKLILANALPITELPFLFTMTKEERAPLLLNCDDPLTVQFFHRQWETMAPRDQITYGGAAPRRADLLTDSPILKYSFGQKGKMLLDPRKIMDERTCVLISLGRCLEPDTKRFLGAICTILYEMAALSRVSSGSRAIHQLIIDEMGEFVAQSGEALARMLDQTRKYGLFATLSQQTLSQFSDYRRLNGALANAAVKIAFQLSADDAETMSHVFADFDPNQIKKEAASQMGQPVFLSAQEQYAKAATFLKNLPPRHAVVRIGADASRQMVTIPASPYHSDPHRTRPEERRYYVDPKRIEDVKQGYYRRYYTRREEIVLPHERRWNGGVKAQRMIE